MSFNSVLALEPSRLLLPGARISLTHYQRTACKDKCCHYWTFPGRIRLASGYHKVLLTADSGGAEGSPRRATGTMREAPLGAQKLFLGSEHRSVTAGPQSSGRERENQTTPNALWTKIACMLTPRCPPYNKTLACSAPPFQWPIVSSQVLERGPHTVLTSWDSRVDHEMVVFLVRRL